MKNGIVIDRTNILDNNYDSNIKNTYIMTNNNMLRRVMQMNKLNICVIPDYYENITNNNNNNQERSNIIIRVARDTFARELEKYIRCNNNSNYVDTLICVMEYRDDLWSECMEIIMSGCLIIIDEYNGIIMPMNVGIIADRVNKLLKSERDKIMKMIKNAQDSIKMYNKEIWEGKWRKVFDKMGWYTCLEVDKMVLRDIDRNTIDKNFENYWKNYVYQKSLQLALSDTERAYNYFVSDKEFHDMKVFDRDIRVALINTKNTINVIDIDTHEIITEEMKYMNMDIYTIDGEHNMNVKIFKQYDAIIIHNNIPNEMMQLLKTIDIPIIVYDTQCSNHKWLDEINPDAIIVPFNCMKRRYDMQMRDCVNVIESPISMNDELREPNVNHREYIGYVCENEDITGKMIESIRKIQNEYSSIANQYQFTICDMSNNTNNIERRIALTNIECRCITYNEMMENIERYRLVVISTIMSGWQTILMKCLWNKVEVIIPRVEETIEMYNIARNRGNEQLFCMFNGAGEIINEILNEIMNRLRTTPNYDNRNREYLREYHNGELYSQRVMAIIYGRVSFRLFSFNKKN
jgi:hypothetical protein